MKLGESQGVSGSVWTVWTVCSDFLKTPLGLNSTHLKVADFFKKKSPTSNAVLCFHRVLCMFSISYCTLTSTSLFYLWRALGGELAKGHHYHLNRRRQLHSRRIKYFVQGCWVNPQQNEPKNQVSWLLELYPCSTHIWQKTNESWGCVFWFWVWGAEKGGLGKDPSAGRCNRQAKIMLGHGAQGSFCCLLPKSNGKMRCTLLTQSSEID